MLKWNYMARLGVKRMRGIKKKKALVIGAGNILLKDEGLGVRAVEFFRERYRIPKDVECIDAGTSAVSLLSLVKDFRNIIIVDAVASGGPPGSLIIVNAEDLPEGSPLGKSSHELGIKDLLAIAAFEGLRPGIIIIGMVPLDISPGMILSPLIQKKLPEITDMIKDELEALGIKVKKRTEDA